MRGDVLAGAVAARRASAEKTLFMVEGFKIGATYSASWEDARTGLAMLGQGAEYWQYRDGKLQLWDAAMTVWEAGADPSTIFL